MESAIYEIFDTFMLFTPMTITCYNMGKEIENVVLTDLVPNVEDPTNIFRNVLSEFFFIVSDCIAEFANHYYEDYFSFSYWLGDLFFRIFVADNREIIF